MDGPSILLGAHMIGGLARALDSLLGRGEAAVTVPPLDGALRPNRMLDEAPLRMPLEGVDCLAAAGDELVASAGNAVFGLAGGCDWKLRRRHGSAVVCLASLGEDGLAVALANSYVVIEGGRFDGRRYRADGKVNCITGLAASGTELYLTNGSETRAADDWQRDLMERNASGSIWRIDLESGRSIRVADNLAWPAGIVIEGDGLVFSEAWKHRLVRIERANSGRPQVMHADLPGYPGRISPSDNGYWLAVFAPRSQLVEFVLREPAYRQRMLAEVPGPFLVAPKLRSGRSFHEPLQGGGVKHLGRLKPWAPTMSAGLCIRLDSDFQPRSSLHSRADGTTHGVTSVIMHGGQVFAASRGDCVVVSLPLADLGGEA